MAQKTIQANFKRMLTQNYKKIGYLAGLGDNVVLDLYMGGVDFIDGIKLGMKPILVANGLSEKANTNNVWVDVSRRTTRIINRTKKLGKVNLKTWTKQSSTPGVYISKVENLRIQIRFVRQKQGSGKFVTGDNRISQVATAYRDIAYKMWLKVVQENIKADGGWFTDIEGKSFSDKIKHNSRSRGSVEKSIQSIIAQNTNVAHTAGTTKADLAVQQLKDSNPKLSVSLDISAFDIIDYAEKNLDVTFYKNESKRRVGEYSFDTKVEARLGYNEAGSEVDNDKVATINKFEDATQKFIASQLADKNSKWHSLLAGVDTLASKTPKKKIQEDVILDLIKPLIAGKKGNITTTKKVKAKPLKNQNRKIKAKASKNVKATAKISKSINIAGTVVARPEMKKRKKTTNLITATRQINKRLPAEVRRNMGRPALRNQTGRFSNSAKLESLRETTKGISGRYSYMLRPYETFENTGERRWRAGYNPKPLIAKSIRNLALQYTEQRLVQLRRT